MSRIISRYPSEERIDFISFAPHLQNGSMCADYIDAIFEDMVAEAVGGLEKGGRQVSVKRRDAADTVGGPHHSAYGFQYHRQHDT